MLEHVSLVSLARLQVHGCVSLLSDRMYLGSGLRLRLVPTRHLTTSLIALKDPRYLRHANMFNAACSVGAT